MLANNDICHVYVRGMCCWWMHCDIHYGWYFASISADDSPPYKDGARINSPHYLCQMVAEKGTTTYTLVISQYEKNNTIHYTLRVYSTAPFSLTKVSEPYVDKYSKRVTSPFIITISSSIKYYNGSNNDNVNINININNNNRVNDVKNNDDANNDSDMLTLKFVALMLVCSWRLIQQLVGLPYVDDIDLTEDPSPLPV